MTSDQSGDREYLIPPGLAGQRPGPRPKPRPVLDWQKLLEQSGTQRDETLVTIEADVTSEQVTSQLPQSSQNVASRDPPPRLAPPPQHVTSAGSDRRSSSLKKSKGSSKPDPPHPAQSRPPLTVTGQNGSQSLPRPPPQSSSLPRPPPRPTRGSQRRPRSYSQGDLTRLKRKQQQQQQQQKRPKDNTAAGDLCYGARSGSCTSLTKQKPRGILKTASSYEKKDRDSLSQPKSVRISEGRPE